MPQAFAPDKSHGTKLLKLFAKLMLEGKRHYQSDLAEELECSKQTVGRLIGEIENFVGANLEIGTENRRRYYQLRSYSARRTLGLDYEELRYLSICHDLATPHLPKGISQRVQETLFSLSVLMADRDYGCREDLQQRQVGFKPKGYIDYSDYFQFIEKFIDAARDRNVCLVEYKANARKQAKTYYFAPGRVFSMNNALYVQGFQVSKKWFEQERATTFAIHRVLDVTKTDKKYDFEPVVEDQSSFGMNWHEPRAYRIKFDAEAADYVRERIWSEDQKIEELADGGIILTLNAASERELMAWVWSFGEQAAIV